MPASFLRARARDDLLMSLQEFGVYSSLFSSNPPFGFLVVLVGLFLQEVPWVIFILFPIKCKY